MNTYTVWLLKDVLPHLAYRAQLLEAGRRAAQDARKRAEGVESDATRAAAYAETAMQAVRDMLTHSGVGWEEIDAACAPDAQPAVMRPCGCPSPNEGGES